MSYVMLGRTPSKRERDSESDELEIAVKRKSSEEKMYYITQNSLFDIITTKNELFDIFYDFRNKGELFEELYDILYSIQIETYNNPYLEEKHREKNISKIILISFILNTDFFFRMFPDDTYYTNIEKCFEYFKSFDFNVLIRDNYEELIKALFEFYELDNDFFYKIIDIHLDNLYNFPHENHGHEAIEDILSHIPFNFVSPRLVISFSKFFIEKLKNIISKEKRKRGIQRLDIKFPGIHPEENRSTSSSTSPMEIGGSRTKTKKKIYRNRNTKNNKNKNKKTKKHKNRKHKTRNKKLFKKIT